MLPLAVTLLDGFKALKEQLLFHNNKKKRPGNYVANHFPTVNKERIMLGKNNTVNTVDQWKKGSSYAQESLQTSLATALHTLPEPAEEKPFSSPASLRD